MYVRRQPCTRPEYICVRTSFETYEGLLPGARTHILLITFPARCSQEEADAMQRQGRGMTPAEAARCHPAYKTRICVDWQGGHCPRGEACTFAHGLGELRSLFANRQQQGVRPCPS